MHLNVLAEAWSLSWLLKDLGHTDSIRFKVANLLTSCSVLAHYSTGKREAHFPPELNIYALIFFFHFCSLRLIERNLLSDLSIGAILLTY
jgi:hypothetical protein